MWSYDETDLSTDSASGRLNAVRLLVGDTETRDQQVQDEEVQFALGQNKDNIYYAAAWVARAIAGKYSRYVDTQVDGMVSSDYSDRAKHYYSLADNLEYQGKKAGGALSISAGGISLAEMESNRANTDRPLPAFRVGRFDNPPHEGSYTYDWWYRS